MSYTPVWKRPPNKFVRYEEREFVLKPNAYGIVLSGIETIAIFNTDKEITAYIKWNNPRNILTKPEYFYWRNMCNNYSHLNLGKFKPIVGVAIISDKNEVISLPMPNRHHHVIKYMVKDLGHKTPIVGLQGFVTEDGIFLNRIEAKLVALNHNQLLPNHHNGDELFSECVWLPLAELMKLKDYSLVVKAFHKDRKEFLYVRQSSDEEVFCLEINKYLHISNFEYFISKGFK